MLTVVLQDPDTTCRNCKTRSVPVFKGPKGVKCASCWANDLPHGGSVEFLNRKPQDPT